MLAWYILRPQSPGSDAGGPARFVVIVIFFAIIIDDARFQESGVEERSANAADEEDEAERAPDDSQNPDMSDDEIHQFRQKTLPRGENALLDFLDVDDELLTRGRIWKVKEEEERRRNKKQMRRKSGKGRAGGTGR